MSSRRWRNSNWTRSWRRSSNRVSSWRNKWSCFWGRGGSCEISCGAYSNQREFYRCQWWTYNRRKRSPIQIRRSHSRRRGTHNWRRRSSKLRRRAYIWSDQLCSRRRSKHGGCSRLSEEVWGRNSSMMIFMAENTRMYTSFTIEIKCGFIVRKTKKIKIN